MAAQKGTDKPNLGVGISMHSEPRRQSKPSAGLDDDMHLLLGTPETHGNLRVSLELQRWLADESSKDAAAAKERRKAREEGALASKSASKSA